MRAISKWTLILASWLLLTVCTGGVGWAQTIDFSKSMARTNPYVAGAGVAAASCTTANDTYIYQRGNLTSPTDNEAKLWFAEKIQLSSTTTITRYYARLGATSIAGGSATASLFADDGGSPSKPTGSAISGTSKTITIAAEAAYAQQEFVLDTPKTGVTAAYYWIVVSVSGLTEVRGAYKSNSGDRVCNSADGSTWTCDADYSYLHDLKGCQ